MNTIKKTALLARLDITEEEAENYLSRLNKLFTLAEKLDAVDTTGIEPLFHPLEITQPLRADEVTESNQRDLCQAIAPSTEAGLYLVPQVIETANDAE